MADDDVSLPKATIAKLIKDCLPFDVRAPGDTVDLMIECCTEFILLVSSEANEVAAKDKKNIIHPEHVLKALTDLGFGEFVHDVEQTLDQWKQEQKGVAKVGKMKTRAEVEGLTEEEQIALQQRLFAEARARSLHQELSNASICNAHFGSEEGGTAPAPQAPTWTGLAPPDSLPHSGSL